MAIYTGSRYANMTTYVDPNNPNIVHLDPIRTPQFTEKKGDFRIEFKSGDRLDIIAKNFYGDTHLEWVIMDANPQYATPLDVKVGDIIVIPSPERVLF